MNKSVDELIPQKAPFVLIDRVLEFKSDEITTELEVKNNTALVFGGEMQEAGLIENIAQTAAALEGCNAKQDNRKIKIGFIGSVKHLGIVRTVQVGEKLHTKLKIITEAMGINVAEGEIFVEDDLIARCSINIFLKED